MAVLRTTLQVISASIAAVLIALLVVKAFSPGAKVEVTNNTNMVLEVRLFWRNQEATLGSVAPGQSASAEICCEAGVTVVAQTEAGVLLRSDEIYFMSGWPAPKIKATIEDKEIRVVHEFAT